eukprot:2682673-Pyramimonas_sp.AAC.1
MPEPGPQLPSPGCEKLRDVAAPEKDSQGQTSTVKFQPKHRRSDALRRGAPTGQRPPPWRCPQRRALCRLPPRTPRESGAADTVQ